MTNRNNASRRAGLILIHRFPLSLFLFHNHRSLPIPIRSYHLQTLLTLPWLLNTCFLSSVCWTVFLLVKSTESELTVGL